MEARTGKRTPDVVVVYTIFCYTAMHTDLSVCAVVYTISVCLCCGVYYTVLRTNSESKPRCPEQPEAYNFTLIIYSVCLYCGVYYICLSVCTNGCVLYLSVCTVLYSVSNGTHPLVQGGFG